jgi:DNA-binding NarL/FixJ family response regulator
MTAQDAGNERIRVLIVDDHQVVRQGLRTFLELHDDIQVVGEAGDGRTAVEMVREQGADVVLHVLSHSPVSPRTIRCFRRSRRELPAIFSRMSPPTNSSTPYERLIGGSRGSIPTWLGS